MHIVVLAGGSGTRLWPLSRAHRPKQLLRLAGPRSLLQETVARVLPLVPPEQVLVVTERSHADAVAQELPELPSENIIAEPARRGTAGALGLAALWVRRRAGAEVMVSLHSDHLIGDDDAFRRTLLAAVEAAKDGRHLLTLGIQPAEPATSYGYLRVGERIATVGAFAVHRVEEFVEKPSRERAEQYLASGSFLWNSGIFVWRVDTFLDRFAELLPNTFQRLEEIAGHLGRPTWHEVLARLYPTIETETVDVGIMERAGNVAVVPATFPWSDVGSWAELLDVLPSDADGNVVQGVHLGFDTQRCLIFASTKPVATVGVRDLIVVETPDVLLICPRDRAQAVKQLVERLGADEAWRHLL